MSQAKPNAKILFFLVTSFFLRGFKGFVLKDNFPFFHFSRGEF